MRMSHVIKTDQWRSDPQIRPAMHFVVSPPPRSTIKDAFSVYGHAWCIY